MESTLFRALCNRLALSGLPIFQRRPLAVYSGEVLGGLIESRFQRRPRSCPRSALKLRSRRLAKQALDTLYWLAFNRSITPIMLSAPRFVRKPLSGPMTRVLECSPKLFSRASRHASRSMPSPYLPRPQSTLSSHPARRFCAHMRPSLEDPSVQKIVGGRLP